MILLALISLVATSIVGCDGDAVEATSPKSAVSVSTRTTVFTDVARESGLDFQHTNGARGQYRNFEMMTSGGAFLDYNNDGHLDIFLTQANDYDTPDPALTSKLFRNDGDGHFTDVTAEAGVGLVGYAMGCAAADYDRDGNIDMYITFVGHDVLLRNRGDGTFEDVTSRAGLRLRDDDPLFSSSSAWFDYNKDGFLDLYVARYCLRYESTDLGCTVPATIVQEYCGPLAYPEVGDLLFLNKGDGTFTNVTESAGIASSSGYSFAVVCSDFNADGWTDLYVACDQSPAMLWINRKDGTFRDEGVQRGAALNMQGSSIAGMGIALEDFDGDDDFDLFVTNLTKLDNLFLRNQGGYFQDVSLRWGERSWLKPLTGFGTCAFDQDHDGRLDLFVANGAVMRHKVPLLPEFPYNEPNQFLRQDESLRFRDASAELSGVLPPALSRGVASADFDNDGDLDLLVCRSNDRPQLLRNDRASGSWLMVETIDPEGLSPVLNSVIRVHVGQKSWVREVRLHQSYLTTSDPRVHFGLGNVKKIDRVEVSWPDGSKDSWLDVAPNQVISFSYGSGRP